MIQPVCVRGDDGRCVQCGKAVAANLYRRCKLYRRRLPTRDGTAAAAAQRGARAARKREAERRRETPCAFLGPATGQQHKTSCGKNGKFLAEHLCYHVERRRERKRSKVRDGFCTPAGTCQAARVIQPCQSCPLYEARRLIATVPV